MNRIDRLVATLIHLQSKRIVKAEEIARRFEISVRTVYRDIRALEEAGVPIGADAGIGYYIADGYHLPPVMFSKQEAAALLTGEKMLEKMTDESVSQPFGAAMKKIRSVLRTSEKEFLEKLDSSIVVYHELRPTGFPDRFAAQIQEALGHQQVIEAEYHAFHTDNPTKRQIEPQGLCYYGGRWHLLGWCRLRGDYRDFRIDRIKSLRLLEETFTKRIDQPLQHYLDRMVSPGTAVKVVARFTNDAVKHMGEQKYRYGLVEEVKGPESTEMTFVTWSVEYFARWLMMWGDMVVPVYPDELKTTLHRLATEVYAHYNQQPETAGQGTASGAQ